jgi:hypothetical protein
MWQVLLNHKIALIATGVTLVLGGVGYVVKKKNPELFHNLTEPVINGANKVKAKVQHATASIPAEQED